MNVANAEVQLGRIAQAKADFLLAMNDANKLGDKDTAAVAAKELQRLGRDRSAS